MPRRPAAGAVRAQVRTDVQDRAAMRSVVLGARAQAAEAKLNSARPATYTRRRPKRSPMLAAVMIPAAKTSR